ncbi:nucleotidyltransferase family protein [Frankia sp. CiP3]|uniref:nucleotidyltransferase family protein n=1 Tax=Frankia sp. CiP3 TaxID=2880971 RepID=UPI001EF4A80F|nr:nucleotidyltransferase domain-containing protein [Frankia sp. CiP3]
MRQPVSVGRRNGLLRLVRPAEPHRRVTHGFGSIARAEADEVSDVDLLAGLAPGRGLFDLGGFISDAEAALDVHVDVTTVAGPRSRLRAGSR